MKSATLSIVLGTIVSLVASSALAQAVNVQAKAPAQDYSFQYQIQGSDVEQGKIAASVESTTGNIFNVGVNDSLVYFSLHPSHDGASFILTFKNNAFPSPTANYKCSYQLTVNGDQVKIDTLPRDLMTYQSCGLNSGDGRTATVSLSDFSLPVFTGIGSNY